MSNSRAKGLILLALLRKKLKVKVILVQALRLCTGRKAHRGSRGIALLFHDHGTRRWWGVSVTPWPFFTPGKTRYPLYRWMGGPQGRCGQVRKIRPPAGVDPWTVQPVTSLYTDYATWHTLLLLLLIIIMIIIIIIIYKYGKFVRDVIF